MPLARICAGGEQQCPSLPQPLFGAPEALAKHCCVSLGYFTAETVGISVRDEPTVNQRQIDRGYHCTRWLDTHAANLSGLDLGADLFQFRRQRQKGVDGEIYAGHTHPEESACANTDCLANSKTASACSRLTVGKSSRKSSSLSPSSR